MFTEEILKYCAQHSTTSPLYLQDIERDTFLHHLHAHQIAGEYQGRLLSLLSKLKKPQRILELGTFTGYSALCLAEGLSAEGLLITIEKNPELETKILKNIQKSPFFKQIKVKIGEALNLIPQLQEVWDLVFIDADKTNYLNYYQLIFPFLAPKALIIIDNVLWKGKVIELKKDKKTESLQQFNEFLRKDPRVEVMMLPIRDGLTVIQKKD